LDLKTGILFASLASVIISLGGSIYEKKFIAAHIPQLPFGGMLPISLVSSAFAAQLTLTWDPVQSPYLAGYKIYYEHPRDLMELQSMSET